MLKADIACNSYQDYYQQTLQSYKALRYGHNAQQGLGKPTTQAYYIDWKNPKGNIYELAEEVTVSKLYTPSEHRRPDIVLYVNGIAIVVIELKRASVAVRDGINQNCDNQKENEIFHFFTPVQLLLAGNQSEGVWYGTTKTPQNFYLKWKEPTGDPSFETFPQRDYPNDLLRGMLQMLEPSRLLDFVHNCIVFDAGIKKVARPNQYFALQAAKDRIKKNESGIIWHSQGSGKSLTMVWLAQWILENIDQSRVVVITDRTELDIQIHDGFKDAQKKPVRALSGDELFSYLKSGERLVCTLLHKFGIGLHNKDAEKKSRIDKRAEKKISKDIIVKKLVEELPADFSIKGRIFVFVDECHRTQGGILNGLMKKIVGEDAMFIGFTGTPILSDEKKHILSEVNFGSFIHKYTFKEAVEDHVVLDLRYESRKVDTEVSDEKTMDALFESLTKSLKQELKTSLQKRWANMQKLFSSNDRIDRIVADINKDFMLEPILKDGHYNAMLVAGSIYEAYKFWDKFQSTQLKDHCAVVTSYEGIDPKKSSKPNTKLRTEEEYKFETNKKVLGDKTAKKYEEWAKQEFINNPGELKLMIVVDKLLTGFDAPCATFMYIDNKITDQDLFQAICRVNRVYDEGKPFGHIIDYKDLFNEVKDAIEDYSQGHYCLGAFKKFDKDDVDGLLVNQIEQGKKDLAAALQAIEKQCENVREPKTFDEYKEFFVYPPSTPPSIQPIVQDNNKINRITFYDNCKKLARAYINIVNYLDEPDATTYKQKVNEYDNIHVAIMLCTGEIADLKQFDADMRKLLDDYIDAKKVVLIEKFDDFSFLNLIKDTDDGKASVPDDLEKAAGGKKGVAETMAANARRVIQRKQGSDPEEYERLSQRLNRLLEDYQKEQLGYEQLLHEIKAMFKNADANIPESLRGSKAKIALWNNLGKDEPLANAVYDCVMRYAMPNYKTDTMRRKKLQKELGRVLQGTSFDLQTIFNIIIAQNEFDR